MLYKRQFCQKSIHLAPSPTKMILAAFSAAIFAFITLISNRKTPKICAERNHPKIRKNTPKTAYSATPPPRKRYFSPLFLCFFQPIPPPLPSNLVFPDDHLEKLQEPNTAKAPRTKHKKSTKNQTQEKPQEPDAAKAPRAKHKKSPKGATSLSVGREPYVFIARVILIRSAESATSL